MNCNPGAQGSSFKGWFLLCLHQGSKLELLLDVVRDVVLLGQERQPVPCSWLQWVVMLKMLEGMGKDGAVGMQDVCSGGVS